MRDRHQLDAEDLRVLAALAEGEVLVLQRGGEGWSLVAPGGDPAATWVRDEDPVPAGTAAALVRRGLVAAAPRAGLLSYAATAAGIEQLRGARAGVA